MRLIAKEYSEITGITEETWYDEVAQTLTLKRFQDVEHTLAMNRIKYNSFAGKKPKFNDVKDGIYPVATIPTILIEKWKKEEGFDWYKSTKKERNQKLNSNEYSDLRVRPGKL